MTKLKLTILIIFVVLITIFVVSTKPVLHKTTMITDSNYEFVEDVADNVPAKLAPTTVTTKNIPVTTKQTEIKTKPINTTQSTSIKQVPAKIQQTKVKTNKQQIKTTKTTTKTVPIKTTNTTTTSTNVKQQQVVPQNKPVEKPAQTVKVEQIQNTPVQEQKVLTEQEEIIVWNKWRSDLQNQVMKDTKIAAPMGTGFKFSFTVDKFGNLSNVKVWSTNSVYTDLAIRVIKPVLLSYQKKPILNFPDGTKRVITNVTGGFYIARSTEYSTPSDYSDYEKVRK